MMGFDPSRVTARKSTLKPVHVTDLPTEPTPVVICFDDGRDDVHCYATAEGGNLHLSGLPDMTFPIGNGRIVLEGAPGVVLGAFDDSAMAVMPPLDDPPPHLQQTHLFQWFPEGMMTGSGRVPPHGPDYGVTLTVGRLRALMADLPEAMPVGIVYDDGTGNAIVTSVFVQGDEMHIGQD